MKCKACKVTISNNLLQKNDMSVCKKCYDSDDINIEKILKQEVYERILIKKSDE